MIAPIHHPKNLDVVETSVRLPIYISSDPVIGHRLGQMRYFAGNRVRMELLEL